MKKYCKVCGAPIDDEGICTNEKCRMRKLQLRLKELKEPKE